MDSDYPVYCPICGDDGDQITPSRLSSESSIFQCFVKLFGVKWDGKGFPFCEPCRSKLALISELQRDLQELQKRLEEHESELQSKLEGSEVKFENRMVYTRDDRYLKLRKRILGDKVAEPPSNSPENEDDLSEHQQQPFKLEYIMVEMDSPSDNNDDEQRMEFEETGPDDHPDIIHEDIETPPSPSQRGGRKSSQRRRKLVMNTNSASEEDDDDDDDYIPDEDKQDYGRRKKRKPPGKKKKAEHSDQRPVYKKLVIYHDCRLERIGDQCSYKCLECDAILPNTRSVLRSHVVKQHTLLHACPHCFRRFEKASKLQRHLNETHKMLPANDCPICSRPFNRTVSLRNHIWTHYSEQDKAEAVARGEEVPLFLRKEFQCDQCSRSFSYLTLLESHLKEKHGTGGKVEKERELCGICGAAVTNLHAHTRLRHTKEEDKKFECAICKKKFAYNNHLQNHRRLAHSTDKPFQCDVCGREFKLLKWMETHRFGHEEVKPFSCHQCGMTFSRNQVMKRHISTVHEGKKRTDHKKSQK